MERKEGEGEAKLKYCKRPDLLLSIFPPLAIISLVYPEHGMVDEPQNSNLTGSYSHWMTVDAVQCSAVQ